MLVDDQLQLIGKLAICSAASSGSCYEGHGVFLKMRLQVSNEDEQLWLILSLITRVVFLRDARQASRLPDSVLHTRFGKTCVSASMTTINQLSVSMVDLLDEVKLGR